MWIVPIVIGDFGTVTEGLLKGLEDLEVSRRVVTIQTTVFLKTARILRRVLETLGDLRSLKLKWKKPSAYVDGKNSMIVNKKENLLQSELYQSSEHRVNIKENEQRYKYLDLAKKLRKLWNMRVWVIPILVGVLGTVPKGLEKTKTWWKSKESKPSRVYNCGDRLQH